MNDANPPNHHPGFRVAPGGPTTDGWVMVPNPSDAVPHPSPVRTFADRADAVGIAERLNRQIAGRN